MTLFYSTQEVREDLENYSELNDVDWSAFPISESASGSIPSSANPQVQTNLLPKKTLWNRWFGKPCQNEIDAALRLAKERREYEEKEREDKRKKLELEIEQAKQKGMREQYERDCKMKELRKEETQREKNEKAL